MISWGDRIQDTGTSSAVRAHARSCEEAGMAALWSSEAARDPFLPLALAADATTSLLLGTGIAVAYGRTPYATAQTAWDLQRLSRGRFRLGIATQVRAHVERRYGTDWLGGAHVLREYVQCCRAVWDSWQNGTLPRFEGQWFRFTLTNPEFRPAALPAGNEHIPVWIAAVGADTASMAGEVADGLHVHAFHTEGYLRDVVLAAAVRGRERAGRGGCIEATSPVMAGVVHDSRQESILRDRFRTHIAFYASTPAYAKILEHEGLRDLHDALRPLARERRWDEMPALVDDSTIDRFVVLDEPQALAHRLRVKYDGLLTELCLYRDGATFASADDLAELVEGLHAN